MKETQEKVMLAFQQTFYESIAYQKLVSNATQNDLSKLYKKISNLNEENCV